MGNLTVLPQKFPLDSSIIPFDMSSLLASGEAVGAGAVTCLAIIGSDITAPSMISDPATVLNDVIYQKVIGGAEGVTYCLRVAATTNQGNVLITLATLVVTSNNPYDN